LNDPFIGAAGGFGAVYQIWVTEESKKEATDIFNAYYSEIQQKTISPETTEEKENFELLTSVCSAMIAERLSELLDQNNIPCEIDDVIAKNPRYKIYVPSGKLQKAESLLEEFGNNQ